MNSVKFLFGPEPKVTLVEATSEMVVALMTRGYTGKYDVSITEEETQRFFVELGSTKLKAPLEAAQTLWLLEDLTRSLTHQIVRYRTSKIVQESMRFSVQTKDGTGGNPATVMVPQTVVEKGGEFLEEYCQEMEDAFEGYWTSIREGIPVQDARGLLPHNTCTRMFFSVDMRTLAHIAEQRYCCQAQGSGLGESGEWTSIINQMKQQLLDRGYPYYASQLKAPWEEPTCVNCGFGASFDRPCSFQDKFDRNLDNLVSLRKTRGSE